MFASIDGAVVEIAVQGIICVLKSTGKKRVELTAFMLCLNFAP